MRICMYAYMRTVQAVYLTHFSTLVGFESPSSVYTDGFQTTIQTAVREAGALGLGAIRPIHHGDSDFPPTIGLCNHVLHLGN